MRQVWVSAIAVLVASGCLPARGEAAPPKPAAELPEIKELPSPFAFSGGSTVGSKADWDRRRQELKGLFEDYEYGHLPPKPEKMTIARGDVVVDKEAGTATQQLKLNLAHGGKTLVMHVRLVLPQDAKGPVPVIVQGGFFMRGFGPPAKAASPKAKPLAVGVFGKVKPLRLSNPFPKRGYAVAEFDMQEVAADNKQGARAAGVYQLFGDKIDCGGLMAWAWGFHRVIDAIETVDKIDAKKVVVTGHSRYGKAALVAGAFDERIALTVPSHSGCAGAAPYRFIYGKSEQLHNIVGAFPYWFRPDFNQFVGKVERLPVDQHLLLALVAPRALMCTEGTQDAWTNPQGSQLTHAAAKKVYEFLGARDRISIRYRPVGHIPSNEDLLDFADHVFFGKPLSEAFGELPYPEEKNGFRWAAPQ
jgi:endo-1,4-beta-xylanase